ncbi:MAG TPA: sulfite exporter TauE/SafE family protein [Pirellulaceae bacterium]|nr:sulfite exporter TauE/SafE family protein [Pirellulaceae bacterium]HMO90571.1 sulfite exporter TauE/SafE family protein [Pirellulaceae bacterium]HMP71235.1 sulfite exporter TauE/SafE family protein [Pirellulaceae bacterium]
MWIIIGALAIGLSLGLLGSGGSILTVPVLVYLLGHDGKPAIAESLAIVGGISLAGAIPFGWARQIDWRSAIFFGLPGMAGTYGGAWLAKFVPAAVQLILFAGVMLLAAWMMFRQASNKNSETPKSMENSEPAHQHPIWQVIVEGLAVGVLTGLVGVGGGFLIIPALVLLGGLPMRLAIGTSLIVIAAKSFAGFIKYQHVLADIGATLDWQTIGWFVALGIAGTFAGNYLGSFFNQRMLQKMFAVFLVVMGLFVLSQEVPKLFDSELLSSENESSLHVNNEVSADVVQVFDQERSTGTDNRLTEVVYINKFRVGKPVIEFTPGGIPTQAVHSKGILTGGERARAY